MQSTIDLSLCDREPIHLLGKVQPHGVLISVLAETGMVVRASSNLAEHTGTPPADILGKNVAQALDFIFETNGFLKTLLGSWPIAAEALQPDLPWDVQVQGNPYYCVLNLSANELLIELEPALEKNVEHTETIVNRLLLSILDTQQLHETVQAAARLVKDFTGFNRVMIYRFHEDNHGEVVAEAKDDFCEAFFGLHYPATDIPVQARQLYLRNLVRGIKDVNATDAVIYNHETLLGTAPDLSDSILRSVSPVHVEYLKNMGVAASFSVSLVLNNKLWGLIACHHYSPLIPDFRKRIQCKLIGQVLSASFQLRLEKQQQADRKQYSGKIDELSRRVRTHDNLVEALIQNEKINLLHIGDVDGACLFYEEHFHCLGETPSKEQLQALISFFEGRAEGFYHTEQLSGLWPDSKEFKDKASGVLVCRLSHSPAEYILWFKKEETQFIKWAGNPEKKAEQFNPETQRISPRKSFATFLQAIEGRSRAWSEAELAGAMKLREEVVLTMSERATHIRQLNETLRQAYGELETFSYTVSHDLRNPLTNIKNFAEIILEDASDDEQRYMIKKIISNADRMNTLIKEILNYSKLGKQELEFTSIDVPRLLTQVVDELTQTTAYQGLDLRVNVTAGNITGDPIMIYQVFTNLLSNAIKYSSNNPAAKVEVASTMSDEHVEFSISDNGIGIDRDAGDSIFQLFQRSAGSEEFDGTGVGLAIVKRIVQKHKGLIWYESEAGKGTTFFLRFYR